MNYMDYTDDNCMNLFTQGQRARARAYFMNGGIRSSFANGYFTINPTIVSRSCTSITVSLQNQSCLPVTWSAVGGTVSNQSSTQATITGTSGTITLTATSGNYRDTKTFDLGTVITTSNSPNEMCLSAFSRSQNLRIDQGSVIIQGIGFDANSQFEWQRLSNNFTYRTVKMLYIFNPLQQVLFLLEYV